MQQKPAAPLDDDLSLDADWSLGEAAFGALVADLRTIGARTLVEFGAGRSSVRFALALPSAQVWSIESSADLFRRYETWVRSHVPDGRLTLCHRPLAWQIHGASPYLSYRPGPFPRQVDAVIVDGPPHWTRRGREACLYQVLPFLRAGARIYLDDVARRGEQASVANWLRTIPQLHRLPDLEVGHGVARFQLPHATHRPERSWATMRDVWRQALGFQRARLTAAYRRRR